jgi:glycerophosphoryl diester phosphodiesterase
MAKCRATSKNKIFVFEENRSKLVLNNINQIDSTKVKVDGCEINDTGIRCDFLHLIKDFEFYIELKGQDIEHAIAQIERTMKLLSADLKTIKKRSYIICTRSPLNSTAVQNHAFKFRKNYNSQLIIRSSPFTDRY